MRLVIDKKSTSIPLRKINSLCNKKKANDDIELPVVMADVEKSLSTKMEESKVDAPQAYKMRKVIVKKMIYLV